MYSRYESLVRYVICKYYILPCRLSFHIFDGFLWSTSIWNFYGVHIIFLLPMVLVSYLRSHRLIQGRNDLFLCSFSFSFLMFILRERETKRACEWGRSRERGRENPKQALRYRIRPQWGGLIFRAKRSWPEPIPRVTLKRLSHPGT